MKGRTLAELLAQLVGATFALSIAAYFSIVTRGFVAEPDIWWHIRVGDWIAAHHTLPRVGILSQHIERPWMAYSWAFELLVSRLQHAFGLPGLFVFLICLQVLISMTLLIAVRRLAKNAWWSWLIVALTMFACYVEPLRSYQFTILFFTIELAILLEADRRDDDRLLFWLAPLFLLWGNIHIQFVYGMFVLGLYVASRFITKGPRAITAGAFAAAVVCSCIGPNWAAPYLTAFNFATHSAPYQFIEEGMAINFRRPEHYAELLLLMAACFAAGRVRRGRNWLFRMALLFVAGMVSFRSMRDRWFISIVAGFIVAEAVGEQYGDAGWQDDAARLIRPVLQYTLAAMLALGVTFSLAARRGWGMQDLAAFIDGVYPIRATQFVKTSNLKGPIYNDFNWGGFLIFNLPQYPVAIDPRGDLYSNEMIARSLDTMSANPGWQNDPDLARANFVFIERWYPLARALAADSHFRRVYEDHLAVIFVRE